MATHNDITGDRLINTPKVSHTPVLKKEAPENPFKIYQCANCHIKVSTSNGKCPLCGNSLAI